MKILYAQADDSMLYEFYAYPLSRSPGFNTLLYVHSNVQGLPQYFVYLCDIRAFPRLANQML